jgi:two-component system, LytTR family, sensor kinase
MYPSRMWFCSSRMPYESIGKLCTLFASHKGPGRLKTLLTGNNIFIRIFSCAMFNPTKKWNNVLIHVIVWTLYTACKVLIQKLFYADYDDYFGNIIENMALILVFYLNAHFVIERFGSRRMIPVLIFFSIVLLWLYLGILYSFQHFISPLIYGEPAFELSFKLFFWAGVYNFLPFLGFSYGYSYFLRTVRNQRQINQLLIQQQSEREEKMQLAKERLFFEHSFLQAQINPHFLFNALSFLYSRTLPFSAEVSGAIMKLAEIMRYALENHPDPEGKVLLAREINHVRNVIDINQLRFNNRLNIEFEVQGDPGQFRILPLILITLLENAFKHGDLNDPLQPLVIKLCISGEEKKFRCIIRNKKAKGPVEMSYGIGMQNIYNRLEMTYRNKYVMNIKDENDFYGVELILNL